MQNLNLNIPSKTSYCFWFRHLTHGMDIFWFISKPKISNLIPLSLSSDVSSTNPKMIWLLVTPFSVMVLIWFYKGASLSRRSGKFLMTVIQGHVVEIYLVTLSWKISYASVTFGPPFSVIVSSQSKSGMRSISMFTKSVFHLLHCISLLLLVPLRNGVSNLWHVTLTQSRGMVISLSFFTTLLSGSKQYLHSTTLVEWQCTFYLTTLFTGLEFNKQ